MAEKPICWIMPQTDPSARGLVSPEGIFMRTNEGFLFLEPQNILVPFDLIRGIYHVEHKTPWVMADDQLCWVYPAPSYPTLMKMVESGGYEAEPVGESTVFFRLIRLRYMVSAPSVLLPIPTRSRGYRTRKARADQATPFLPVAAQGSEEELRNHLREILGDRLISIRRNEGGTYLVEWRVPPRLDPVQTVIRWDNGWRIVNLGICVSGDDSLIPTMAMSKIVEMREIGYHDVRGMTWMAGADPPQR